MIFKTDKTGYHLLNLFWHTNETISQLHAYSSTLHSAWLAALEGQVAAMIASGTP
jgi:hypothetical protein